MKNRDKNDRRYLPILAVVFVLLAAAIIAAGYRYYNDYAAKYRAQLENQLTSIAELKTGELVHWRQERMGDASLFYKNPLFSAMVERYFEDPGDAEAEGQLRIWLGRFQDSGQYERVMLLDSGYIKKMVVPQSPERNISFVSPGTAAVLQTGQVAFEDFYYDEVNQKIYLKVMVPIFAPADGSRIIGFLALRIDPSAYLYPLLQRWPTPSATAETLIVRRDGNSVLYLNELKFQQDTALKLRIPLERIELPAVKGTLGYEGIVDGIDYRGDEVIAAVRGVPDSPWILVARMDTAEVYEPLTQMLWVIMVLIGALLTGAGAGVGLVWRRRSQLFYRQRAEVAEALRESERRYREFFTVSRDCVFISSPDGRLIDFNDATLEMFGYDNREEFLGVSIITLYDHPEDRSVFIDLILRDGHVQEFPVRLKRKGGTVIDALMTAVAQRNQDGTVKALVGTARDVTERKQTQDKLKVAFEELRSSNDELERFTYTISHDLKSPLVTIKTFLGYLKQDMPGPDAGKIEKDMQFMEGAADKMSRLLDELLEMSRIGRVVNPPVTVTFGELVQEALDMVAGGISERGVAVHVSAEALNLYGDRPRLVEIWQNLLENAVKFMGGQESPRIDIGFEQRASDTVFFVRDNGMGIDPRYKSRVFNLFDKLDAKAEGTGLGLAIVRRIVELYKGAVWIESAGAGQGSCFLFTLPAALQDKSEGERT
jgi:PAS domain S-box-containing protein